MRNKLGWMRILEATISVLLVTGVLLFIYSEHDLSPQGIDDYVSNLQKKILKDISFNVTLRNFVLSDSILSVSSPEFQEVNGFVNRSIAQPPFNYSLRICDLGTPCKMDSEVFQDTLSYEIYSEEIVISANITKYNPRKVRLFLWELE
jgi:hypothetical protein